MRYHFITFGNEPWHASVDRVCAEARALGVFDEVRGYTEADLSEEDRAYAAAHPRGYGFWRWKPAVCVRHLETLEPGDVLLYADAGCVFNPPAKARLLEYAAMARESGIVGFQMTHVERQWTKRELLQVFHCEHRPEIVNTGQIEATAFVVAKTEHGERILRSWNAIPRWSPLAIDDTLTIPQASDFREHRHDQSIFSLLLKLYGAKVLGWETWCWGESEAESAQNPIWETRRRLRIPVLMSGPVRPSEESVLSVIANVRRQIPGCELFFCTWTGQLTPRIQTVVDHSTEIDEPTGEEINQNVWARTIQFRQAGLQDEFWCWPMYRMIYGIGQLCSVVQPCIADTDVVVRVRTDHWFTFEPGYLHELYRHATNGAYVARYGTGFDWFCMTPFSTFQKVWRFETIDDYNREVNAAWNTEALLQKRVRVPIVYYDKSRVDEYIIRGHTNQRFP
jgi:hypothetical protein